MPITGEILAAGSGLLDIRSLVAVGGLTSLGIVQKVLRPYVRVEQGDEVIRTRGGNCSEHKRGPAKGKVKILGPGPHLMIPFSHEMHRQSIKAQTTPLGEVRIDRAEEPRYDCEATVQWRVVPSGVSKSTIGKWFKPWGRPGKSQLNDYPYRARFETDDLEGTVKTICRDGLAKAMTTAPKEEFRDSKAMTDEVKEACREELLTWGAEVLRITLDQPGVETDIDRLGAYMQGLPPEDMSQIAGVAAALSEGDGQVVRLQLLKGGGDETS